MRGFRVLATLFFASITMVCFARGNEPGNNLGKTLQELWLVFPNARYVSTDFNVDYYTDGEDPSEGVSCFFYWKNNRVVEEGMIVQSDDGFPKMTYDQFLNTFSKYLNVAAFSIGVNHMCFSTFSMHIMYFSEYGKNTFLLLYLAGGAENGITYSDFINTWSR